MHTRSARITLVLATLTLSGILAACAGTTPNTASAGGDEPDSGTDSSTEEVTQPATSSTGAEGSATLNVGEQSYTVELKFCSLFGGQDALFHGTAFDTSGTQVGYLEGDFGDLSDHPHGEARIDFGATGKLQSTDEFVAMGSVMGDITVTDLSDSTLMVSAVAWDQDGTQLPTAMLSVKC